MPRDDKHIQDHTPNLFDRLREWVLPETGKDTSPHTAQIEENDGPDWGAIERDHQAYLDQFALQPDPDMAQLQEQRKARDELAERLKRQCERFSERTGWGDLELDTPPANLTPDEREIGRILARQRAELAQDRDQLEQRFIELMQRSWDSVPGLSRTDTAPVPERDSKTAPLSHGSDPAYNAFLKDVRHAYETRLDSRQQREFAEMIGGRENLARDDFLNEKALAMLDRHSGLLKIEDRQDNGRRVELHRQPDVENKTITYGWRVSEIGGETLAQGSDNSRAGAAEALGLARDRYNARSRERQPMPSLSSEDKSKSAGTGKPDKPKAAQEKYPIIDLDDPNVDVGEKPKARADRSHGHERE